MYIQILGGNAYKCNLFGAMIQFKDHHGKTCHLYIKPLDRESVMLIS